jgi:hypothetical protein
MPKHTELAIMRHTRWKSASVRRAGYVEEGTIWTDIAAAFSGCREVIMSGRTQPPVRALMPMRTGGAGWHVIYLERRWGPPAAATCMTVANGPY